MAIIHNIRRYFGHIELFWKIFYHFEKQKKWIFASVSRSTNSYEIKNLGWLVCKECGFQFVEQSDNLVRNELTLKKWTMLPMLDCLSYWFYPNCFSLLMVLVILSNLQWQWWFGNPINTIEELLDYQRGQDVKGQGHNITVKVCAGLQLVLSYLAYLSALLWWGEKSRSLPHWYLFITFFSPLAMGRGRRPKEILLLLESYPMSVSDFCPMMLSSAFELGACWFSKSVSIPLNLHSPNPWTN